MSYLSELTAHERLTVDNATLDMFTAFENGSDLIYDIWEQYFSDNLLFLGAVSGLPCVSVTVGLLRLLECAESGVVFAAGFFESCIELSGINVKFAHGVNYPFFFMRCRAVFFKGR